MDISNPETISRFKKHRYLLSMTEDDFRDQVVRPLFLRQGFRDGRDLCGPFEKGKDAVFVATDKMGIDDVYVVQTKKGNVNLSRKASENLIEAITQLKTASETKVTLLKTKQTLIPTKVILCASGKINDSAKQHIVDQVNNPRVLFLDSDDLIPRIDELFRELWLGIDAEVAPYFRKLKQVIESSDDALMMVEVLPPESHVGVASADGFVMLQLYQMTTRVQKASGQMKKVPHLVQMPVTGLLKKKKKHLSVIFGGAGSGKSTSLKRLAFVLAKKALKFESAEEITIPFLLRAADIACRDPHSLVEVCDAESRKLTGLSASCFSPEDLNAGRVLLLVDALDEVPNEDARAKVLELIKQFSLSYPNCSAVVTSRDYDSVKSLSALSDFERYNLSPINHRQAYQILKSLQKGKNLSSERTEELVRRLDEVHGMELNPLLVTVFAATSDYSRQDIPANITELFKKYTEMMLGRWDASKGFRHQYHAPLKDFILTKVAFEMHRDKLTSIDTERFDRIVETELDNRGHTADIAQLREEILNRSGLFVVLDSRVEFRHLMMQEFFAGRGVQSVGFLHGVVNDPWWRRALIFYYGEHPEDSRSLQATISSLRDKSVEDNYHAALALGLALQACYLVEVKDKIDIYKWVIDSISNAKSEFLEAETSGKFPIGRFLFYYLFGRDSVAFSLLESRLREIQGRWSGDQLSQEESDIRTFWVIVGLIECGAIKDAEELLDTFEPSDARLLLAIHLGAVLVQHVRISSKQQSEAAKRICERLSAHVIHLRQQLLNEMSSELLEVRRGTVKVIGPDRSPGDTQASREKD